MFNNNEWLNQVTEAVIDPEREIVDPHHHLWPPGPLHYDLPELLGDTGGGHSVTQTVFIECGSSYSTDGPEHLRCVGETRYVADAAIKSRELSEQATIAGIVAHADLRSDKLEEILDAHEEAAQGLFKGIRHQAASDSTPDLAIPAPAKPKLLMSEDFRRGVKRLGERRLSFDAWIYHHQLPELIDLAKAIPTTKIVLDHFGTPLGVGPYETKKSEIFEQWKKDIKQLAELPNTYAKLGGLAMPDNGFEWHTRATPPSSDEIVASQRHYYDFTIDCFGPSRCMFESNFPVDRLSLSYTVLWNAFKKMTVAFSDSEKDDLFSGVARRVYRL